MLDEETFVQRRRLDLDVDDIGSPQVARLGDQLNSVAGHGEDIAHRTDLVFTQMRDASDES